MKIKGFTGTKTFDGEVYRFKNGVCVVPGMRFQRKPVTITFKEFRELTR